MLMDWSGLLTILTGKEVVDMRVSSGINDWCTVTDTAIEIKESA